MKLVIVRASAFLGLFASLAQTVSAGSSVAAELAVGSRYVFRGVQGGELTAVPSLEAGLGNAYFGLLSVVPLEERSGVDGYEDRHDFYTGYGWAAGSRTALEAGGTYRYRPDGADAFEGFLGGRREMGTVAPSFYVYRDFEARSWSAELSADVAAPIERFPFRLTVFVGHVEASQTDDYSYYGIDARYPVELSGTAKLTLGLHYAGNTLGGEVRSNHFFGTAALGFGF